MAAPVPPSNPPSSAGAAPGATDDSVLTPALLAEGRQRAQPVIGWLLAVRLMQQRSTLLFDGFLRQLKAVGVPVERSTLHLPQLHPQLRARTLLWEAEAGGAMEIPRVHGIEQSDFFLKSPVHPIFEGGPPIRRRLALPGCPLDFPITEEVAAQGFTDYTARPLPFSTRQINTLTLASRQPQGFSDLDIATVESAMPLFGLLMELRNAYRTSRTLMETYVGTRSGPRVLAGTIQRGNVERINAVLWTCDLRDFTELSTRLPMEEVIDLLNAYFDVFPSHVIGGGLAGSEAAAGSSPEAGRARGAARDAARCAAAPIGAPDRRGWPSWSAPTRSARTTPRRAPSACCTRRCAASAR
jgi:adenylate cyclase